MVQEILHTLIDRHENVIKLYANRGIVKNIGDLELKVEKASRQDIMFMRKVTEFSPKTRLKKPVMFEALHGVQK